MTIWQHLTRTEKNAIRTCIVGILISLLFIWDDTWLDGHFNSQKSSIGEFSTFKNDLRYKPAGYQGWSAFSSHQTVGIGDSVFSGENSSGNLILKKGGQIQIGENSLVSFKKIEDFDLADLADGTFKIHVEGEMKVAIDGKISTIKGNNAEIELKVKAGKPPQYRISSGHAQLTMKQAVAVTITRAIPKPTPTVYYSWKFSDLYDLDGSLAQEKMAPTHVPMPVELHWGYSHGVQNPVYIQHSTDKNSFAISSEPIRTDTYTIDHPALGKNYWRISVDRSNWSNTAEFKVAPRFGQPVPILATKFFTDYFRSPFLQVPWHVRTKNETDKVIVQAGLSDTFAMEQTRTFLSTQKSFQLSFYKPGTYFYRFRSVAEDGTLSDWSQIATFKIQESPDLPAPQLSQQFYEATPGTPIRVEWSHVAEASATHISVVNAKGQILRDMETREHHSIFRPKQAGSYWIFARSINQQGQMGTAVAKAELVARIKTPPPPAPIQLPPLAQKKKMPREPAEEKPAMESIPQMRMPAPPRTYASDSLSKSRLTIEGAAFTMQSSQQYYDKSSMPLVLGMKLRLRHWFKDNGAEISYKSGFIGVNPAGAALAPRQIEARYLNRHVVGFPFALSRRLEVSLIAGVESYRATSASFSNSYDLVKFGTALDFPLGERFGTGGEILLGLGADQSKKYELSGYLDYFRNKNWSAGIGYRIHLFQAGSVEASAAGYIPYREGYTEGFSTLQFYY